jgi:hypothetical protein
MVPKCELLESIPLHIQELNYGEGIYELVDHVGEKALNSNLSSKLGLTKKNLASFLNHLLKSA